MNLATNDQSEYFFVACQYGANKICKEEVARSIPSSKLAYSRPGFLTFKSPIAVDLSNLSRTTFVRCFGKCLGGFKTENDQELISRILETHNDLKFNHLHVFERDKTTPGKNNFEPGVSERTTELVRNLEQEFKPRSDSPKINRTTVAGATVFNVIIVEPNYYWLGTHSADSISARWPGGVPVLSPPEDMISRAYLKISEAVKWSQIPIGKQDLCVEIGSAPGGSCQYLLEFGTKVIAIDPAKLSSKISSNPNLVHIQKRGKEIKRSLLRNAKWLFCDANVTPNAILSTIESWANDSIRFRGILLTLKIADESWFDQIEEYRQRIKNLGYSFIKTRQLAFNRQEICLAAFRNKAVRRFG